MSMQPENDVLRYVLADPTLDRDAFEQRMLHDPDLALAVADCQIEIEQLRAASLSLSSNRDRSPVAPVLVSSHVTSDYGRSKSQGWHWTSLASLAVVLLVAVGISMYSLDRTTSAQGERPLAILVSNPQALADRWLAMDSGSEFDTSSDSLITTDCAESSSAWTASHDASSAGETSNTPEDSSDEQDWLMQAAHQFYAEGVAS